MKKTGRPNRGRRNTNRQISVWAEVYKALIEIKERTGKSISEILSYLLKQNKDL